VEPREPVATEIDRHAERVARLRRRIAGEGELVVAFSGGVDSAVLLHAAHDVLGERAVALIADSPSLARAELDAAREFARTMGVRLVEVRTDELADPRYRANAGDRCYYCKSALFDAMTAWAGEHGFARLAFGEITDDRRDDRPGARAAREAHVLAPLSEAGLSKDDVRRYAREHGLAVWDKPQLACLASRLPVGTTVTRERLARIEAAEAELRSLGLRQLRVRDHGRSARVEVGADELAHAESQRAAIGERLRALDFERFELAVYASPAARRGEART